MNKLYKSMLPLLSISLLAGCKKETDTYYKLQDSAGFFNVGIAGPTFNTTFATKYGPGKSIPITAAYNQTDSPATITVFQATKTDSMQVGSYPAAGTFVRLNYAGHSLHRTHILPPQYGRKARHHDGFSGWLQAFAPD
jgi:hypothetical protein